MRFRFVMLGLSAMGTAAWSGACGGAIETDASGTTTTTATATSSATTAGTGSDATASSSGGAGGGTGSGGGASPRLHPRGLPTAPVTA